MLSKFKTFSEDVVKSLNDLSQSDKLDEAFQQLKDGAELLRKPTPDAGSLSQPENDAHTPISEVFAPANTQDQTAQPAGAETKKSAPNLLENIEMDDLPPLVRSKLKKFAKYEDKYPVLLEAYKTEKRKSQLVEVFEKSLLEYTPVLSISDVDMLVHYLKGVTDKAALMDSELRRFASDNARLAREKDDLAKKVADSDKALKYSEQTISKHAKDAEAMKATIKDLEQNARAEETRTVVDNLRALIAAVEKKLEVGAGDADAQRILLLEQELEALRRKESVPGFEADLSMQRSLNEEITKKLEQLQVVVDEKTREVETQSAETAFKDKELVQACEQLQTASKELETAKSELDAAKSELERARSELGQKMTQLDDAEKQLDCLRDEHTQTAVRQVSAEPAALKAEKYRRLFEALKERSVEQEQTLQRAQKSFKELEADKYVLSAELERLKTELGSDTDGEKTASVPKNKGRKRTKDKFADDVEKNSEEETSTLSETAATAELAQLQSECNRLSQEKTALLQELSACRAESDQKTEDLDTLRDLLRDLGDELVTVKDQLKSAEREWAAHSQGEQQRPRDNVALLAAQKEESDKARASVAELSRKLANTGEELEISLRENERLAQEKHQLNTRVDELMQVKSNDGSLKLEIASLQAESSHKDEQLRELKSELDAKNRELDEMTASIATLRTLNQDLLVSNQGLVSDKAEMHNKTEEAQERWKAMTAELVRLQESKHCVTTEWESLKLKHDTLTKTRADTASELEALRQQHEEVLMRAKGCQNKIDNLEEEVSDARRMFQERTREATTLRRILSETTEDHERRGREMHNEMRALNDEKTALLADLLGVRKRAQHEVKELTAETEKYSRRVLELQGVCDGLRDQLTAAQQASKTHSPENEQKQRDLESTIHELQASLRRASEKMREYENLNQVLKKLNDEANSKFERLTKNYKLIGQQYRLMKEQKERVDSELGSRLLSFGATEKPQAIVDYLKNVLIGFLEHKDQRHLLLPVLAQLFQLSAAEEQTLMLSLK